VPLAAQPAAALRCHPRTVHVAAVVKKDGGVLHSVLEAARGAGDGGKRGPGLIQSLRGEDVRSVLIRQEEGTVVVGGRGVAASAARVLEARHIGTRSVCAGVNVPSQPDGVDWRAASRGVGELHRGQGVKCQLCGCD
jgi:hypothetical protein